MIAHARLSPAPMTPTPTARWKDTVRSGRIFCGPEGIGHHIPARFFIPEHGYVQCTAPAPPPELLELQRLRLRAPRQLVERFEANMRARGVDVPDDRMLKKLIADAPMCGRWVFLVAIRGPSSDKSGMMVFEVTKEDRLALDGLSTPAEVLEYLGAFTKR